MTEASCHCGAVRIEVPAPPAWVNDCACSICRRLGTLWAYYTPREVRVTGPTTIYTWNKRVLEFHACATCHCTTHWYPVDPSAIDRMGVNARLMEPAVLAAAERRFGGRG